MVVRNQRDLEGLMRIGQICGLTLQHMLKHVEPGITTHELDRIGEEFLKKHNAASAPITAYNYPGWTCISINDEAAHGIPGNRKVQPGDIVNVDVSAVLEGYWGDTGASIIVPPVSPRLERLTEWTRKALNAGIAAAKEGDPVYEIGRAVHQVAREGGYTIIKELGGHGVGLNIHEGPTVHNFMNRRAKQKMVDGLVITIEPFLNLGKGKIYTEDDGWTLRTRDGSISCQYEHTVIINGNDPILATKVEGSH
ncbi:type I methionyl aminopeptidase [Phototrophicus methaneseepsis]|uniref:Methionine aminopeptidase n=1 Tax=Phototrophicus methaneseepsis TaxID=2710758 RepID=A0A7S8EBK8_9CHLR|nr:type I methionyl aminopeptidase [Phototrophicus methaneseepsis]QPC83975.1 type I methionyl aminopeptidase [Phototrophicus methaneseepsis]